MWLGLITGSHRYNTPLENHRQCEYALYIRMFIYLHIYNLPGVGITDWQGCVSMEAQLYISHRVSHLDGGTALLSSCSSTSQVLLYMLLDVYVHVHIILLDQSPISAKHITQTTDSCSAMQGLCTFRAYNHLKSTHIANEISKQPHPQCTYRKCPLC